MQVSSKPQAPFAVPLPGTHWVWGWLRPRTGRNAVEKRESNTGRPARCFVTILNELLAESTVIKLAISIVLN
jgi:hypothetical protein